MSATFFRKLCLCALMAALVSMALMNGCGKDNPSQPADVGQAGMSLKIFANPDTQAKLTGLTLDIVGLSNPGEPAVSLSRSLSLSLPVTVPLTLYDPPCLYQVTATASLMNSAPRVVSRMLDICRESRLTLYIDSFEGFWLAANPLQTPVSVKAGDAVNAVCGTNAIDAPDKAQYPLQATLREQDGLTVSARSMSTRRSPGRFPIRIR